MTPDAPGPARRVRIVWTKWVLLGLAVIAILIAGVFSWQPILAGWHRFRARHFLHVRENERALEQLQAAIRLDQRSPETYFLLARTHRRLKNTDLVLGFLHAATARGGDPEQSRREMRLLLAQVGNMHLAEPHLSDLLTDPRGDGPDIFEAYVLGYVANMRFDGAGPLLRAWQSQYPDDPEAYFINGYVDQSLGRLEDAAAVYRKALELLPGRTVARCELAKVLTQLRQWDEAEAEFQRCVDEAPHDTRILADQATFYLTKGDLARARALLQEVLAMAPDDFFALQLLGRLDVMESRFEEAAGCLLKAARQHPNDKDTRLALGTALQRLGRTAEAKPHLDYAAEANRATAEIVRKSRDAARRPEDVELRFEIGSLMLKYGEPAEATAWLHSVLQLKPDHEGANRALASYYEERSDFRAASIHRERLSDKRAKKP